MPTSTHPAAPKRKHPRAGADGRYCTGFQFSPRRGGRPCPPAGIARFYGNPMRNRNILEGRCGHRPLQKTSQDFTILEGGQGRPPLQKTSQNAIFSVSRRRGRCLHRPTLQNGNTPARGGWALLYRVSFSPLQNASQNAIFSVSRRRGRCPHRPTLQNGNTPARGRMDVIVLGFVFAPAKCLAKRNIFRFTP